MIRRDAPPQRRSQLLFATLTTIAITANGACAVEQEEPPTGRAEVAVEPEEKNRYGAQGSFELGGTLGASVLDDAWGFQLSPSFGYFVADGFELSLIATGQVQRTRDDDGTTTTAASGILEVEPSYHHAVTDTLLAFGGLGVGPAYDGDGFALAVVPRVGVNVRLGESALLTPAVRAPVTFDDEGASIGVLAEIGVGTTW